jgi:DNA-binding NarL/FixJ family response regulator
MLVGRIQPLLLLEDDSDDEAFVRRALAKARIKNPLMTCRTPAGARKQLAKMGAGELPILLICDIFLPGRENGIDFLRWLRVQPPPLGTMPAMVYSVSDRPEHADEARALGSIVFLRKPVTEETLAVAVQSLGFVVAAASGEAKMERVIQSPHIPPNTGR